MLKSIFNKNSCVDLFQNLVIEGRRMYEPQPTLIRIKNKIERSQVERRLNRLILISQLKSIDRLLLIDTRLKMYELIKWLFIFDISYGQEVYIPETLNQKSYPDSCKFYDPIIAICLEGISMSRKQFFHSQNEDKILEFKKYHLAEQVYDQIFGADTKN